MCSTDSSLCTTLKLKPTQHFRTDAMFHILPPSPSHKKKYVTKVACFNLSVQVPVLSCANLSPILHAHVSSLYLWSHLKLPAIVVNDKVAGLQILTVNWKSAKGAKIIRNLEHAHSNSQTHGHNCTLRCTLYKVGGNRTAV